MPNSFIFKIPFLKFGKHLFRELEVKEFTLVFLETMDDGVLAACCQEVAMIENLIRGAVAFCLIEKQIGQVTIQDRADGKVLVATADGTEMTVSQESLFPTKIEARAARFK